MNQKNIEIRNKDIILRDRCTSDIDDYITWYTTEKEWQNWDAPWEKKDCVDINKMKLKIIEQIQKPLPKIRRRFEICYKDEKHIGWMNSYYIQENKNMFAIGIDIASREYRGNKLGEYAFKGFIRYLFNSNIVEELYCQTWSGNIRMMKLALKCGFEECDRKIDFREINGKLYDGLTFVLSKSKFLK